MKKLVLAAAATVASASTAFAADCINEFGQTVECAVVPEISALQGTAALAALAAVMLLVWERRRRAV